MGNLRSVAKALRHVAPDEAIVVSDDPDVIAAADKVVLPGQSAMPDCMRCLNDSGLREVVELTAGDRPFLGICLGLQMLFDVSDEGPAAGLGILSGRVVRFRTDADEPGAAVRLKIPHMGWSPVDQRRAHPLWHGIENHSRFYFAHSYFPEPGDPGVVAATV